MMVVVRILFATGFTYHCCLFTGRFFMRAAAPHFYREEERFLSFVVGAALVSTAVFLLTALGLAYASVFFTAGAVLIAAGVWLRLYISPSAKSFAPLPKLWAIAFWTIYCAFAFLYLSNALAPEVSPDGVFYHVALPARYLREHHFPWVTTDMFSYLPQGVEMLFLFAFALGKHSATAMVEFLFLLLTPLGMLAYGRRIGYPAAGAVGALLFFVAPITGKTGVIAYVDVAVAAIAFAIFCALQIWRETYDNRILAAIGILAGFGYAAKYTAFVGGLYAFALVVYHLIRLRRSIWRPALILGCGALLMILPWVVKNLVTVSNPAAPFLNSWFPNPFLSPAFERGLMDGMRHFNGVVPGQVPLEITLRGARLQGLIGPVFLLGPLALLALRIPAGRELLLAFAIFLAPYFENIGARFILPCLPFLSLALALVLTRVRFAGPIVLLLHAAASWPSVMTLYADRNTWRIEGFEWRAALRAMPEATYIRSRMDTYDMGLAVDKNLARGQPILAGLFPNRAYDLHDVIIPFGTSLGERLYDMLVRVVTPEMQPTRSYVIRFAPVRAMGVRLMQTRASKEMWSTSEVRLFHGEHEIPRAAAWRLRASANPWEAGLAFDNSPVTMWRTQQTWRPNTFIEVNFDRAVLVDCIRADAPQNQNDLALDVEVESANGGWQSVTSVTLQAESVWPPRMRRAAAEEIKASGVNWIIVTSQESFARDFLQRADQWGITQIAKSGPYRLWRID
jgi:hypothetical protein